jgi:hypothetical protein
MTITTYEPAETFPHNGTLYRLESISCEPCKSVNGYLCVKRTYAPVLPEKVTLWQRVCKAWRAFTA